ncbi:DUF2332 domain-containing protein [Microbacterium sp. NPDC076911]|uniref:DUF2332 domain-containing protein n=1 Tax=Microbacterium sp. NPDC076911 TaxID=3154958 RepID=UPI00342423E8
MPESAESAEQTVVARYGRFARDEAPGRSAVYEEWAKGVAAGGAAARTIARLAPTHRQPPLVFAVARMLGAPESTFGEWSRWLREHAEAFVTEASRRSLQTNEPLRCAALLPALSVIEGPIALLEIGASAGLCLVPDRYSYRYGALAQLDPRAGASTVVLDCELVGQPSLRLPEIVWRRGIDLQPLDASLPDDRGFLAALVWPGEVGRSERISGALDIAARESLIIDTGDATDAEVLQTAVASAPNDATLVVTTPGVLPHIAHAGRERLVEAVRAMDAEWISIDPPSLYSRLANSALDGSWDRFVLSRNGEAIANVDPLGGYVEWRADEGHAAR